MDHAEARRIERAINHELAERFPDGTIVRAELRLHDDDPAIEPGQLMVRVLIPAPSERAVCCRRGCNALQWPNPAPVAGWPSA